MKKSILFVIGVAFSLVFVSCMDNCRWVECDCYDCDWDCDCDCGYWDCSDEYNIVDIEYDSNTEIVASEFKAGVASGTIIDGKMPHIVNIKLENKERSYAFDVKCQLVLKNTITGKTYSYNNEFETLYSYDTEEWNFTTKPLPWSMNYRYKALLTISWMNEDDTVDMASYEYAYMW